MPLPTTSPNIITRPLNEKDLTEAKRIFHVAFGTFLGLADPAEFWPDRDYIRTRYFADPSAALGAEVDGELVGSNFAANWGSVGFFGPLTIRPDYWDRGVGKRLLERTMEIFENWGTEHIGLFTFAQSAKHVGLYQKFGFWPRYLTAVMSAEVRPSAKVRGWTQYSQLSEDDRAECLRAARDLTNAITGWTSSPRFAPWPTTDWATSCYCGMTQDCPAWQSATAVGILRRETILLTSNLQPYAPGQKSRNYLIDSWMLANRLRCHGG